MKALVAIEHSMLVAIWLMFNDGATYDGLGVDYYAKRDHDRAKKRALDQLRDLSYSVTLEPTPVAA